MLCQLHLCLRLSRLRSHGEDVEDERGAVENLHLQFLLYVTHLLGVQFVIEDHHTHRLGSPPYGPRGGFISFTDYSVPLGGRQGGF